MLKSRILFFFNSKQIFFTLNICLLLVSIVFIFIKNQNLEISGDEFKFYKDLIYANENGLISLINKGTSITFSTSSYLIDQLINYPKLSIKLTSLFSFLILLTIWVYILNFKIFKLNKLFIFFLFSILVYASSLQNVLFSGINDLLLDIFGLLMFIILLKENNKMNADLLSLSVLFALCLATRKMSITYLAVLIPILFIFSKKGKVFVFRLITLSIIFLALFNLTSLFNSGKFSFDDKPLHGNINWAQWDYHNAMLIDANKQTRFQHTKISSTEEYIALNGPTSLPSTFSEMIFFDIRLTIKEFFIDLYYTAIYFFREFGIISFLFLFFFIISCKEFKKKSKLKNNKHLIYIFCGAYLIFINFIVITNIQMRWFMFFIPVLLSVTIKDFKDYKYSKMLLSLNNIILLAMQVRTLINLI